MNNFISIFVPALALAASLAPSLQAAETGALRVDVLEADTLVKLDQAKGSGIIDYNADYLYLTRVSTTCIFYDGSVDVMVGGYKVGSYATDYVPFTQSGVMVYQMTTTYIKQYLRRPLLQLAISPTSATEGGSATATLTLTNSAGTSVTIRNALTVTLASNNTGRATVPASVQIPANTSSVSFTVSAVNNLANDGDASVGISATAGTWGSDSASILVIDND